MDTLKLLEDFDKEQSTSYLTYLDANNLYDWAMCQYMPYVNFKSCKSVVDCSAPTAKPMEMTMGDLDTIANARQCHICGKSFTDLDENSRWSVTEHQPVRYAAANNA
ncbi:hypothetical protein J6590_073767 [Homalodisca vitripennis]|nr:hypothetical protein J6590_073767 [Homalodisca vitripennis]